LPFSGSLCQHFTAIQESNGALMNIEKDSVVTFHYQLTDDQGRLIESSTGQDPMSYLHGSGAIIPGLAVALDGKTAGDNFQVTVEPEQAYGPVQPDLFHVVPRESFAGADELTAGMIFQADGPQGRQIVRIVKVEDEQVHIDANHPLAGQVLVFDVTIEAVRPATPEEIAHGHAH
jgi:FKBP-type peptidyl-prolyl cis-trans isomerase SlyD